MQHKNTLGRVYPNADNLRHGRLPRLRSPTTSFWHSDAVGGRPPQQQSRARSVWCWVSLPLDPTYDASLAMTKDRLPSKRRLQLQVIQPVHRLDVEAPLFAGALHVERNVRAGAALRVDGAIEVGQPLRDRPADAHDDIAAPHAGLVGRAARSHGRDDPAP